MFFLCSVFLLDRAHPHEYLPDKSGFKVFENVIPNDDALAVLEEESYKVSRWAMEQSAMLQGKRPTCWLPSSAKKHNLMIEDFVRQLANIVEDSYGEEYFGYEYWVQRIDPKQTPSFHYDKDEAKSSHENIFIFPNVSSIFYFEDEGQPTLVWNQTCPDGKMIVPRIPETGMFAYPKRNKYVLFPGNLAHGVLPGNIFEAFPYSKTRSTLLVNFWFYKPAPPNIVNPPVKQMIRKMKMRRSLRRYRKAGKEIPKGMHIFKEDTRSGHLSIPLPSNRGLDTLSLRKENKTLQAKIMNSGSFTHSTVLATTLPDRHKFDGGSYYINWAEESGGNARNSILLNELGFEDVTPISISGKLDMESMMGFVRDESQMLISLTFKGKKCRMDNWMKAVKSVTTAIKRLNWREAHTKAFLVTIEEHAPSSVVNLIEKTFGKTNNQGVKTVFILPGRSPKVADRVYSMRRMHRSLKNQPFEYIHNARYFWHVFQNGLQVSKDSQTKFFSRPLELDLHHSEGMKNMLFKSDKPKIFLIEHTSKRPVWMTQIFEDFAYKYRKTFLFFYVDPVPCVHFLKEFKVEDNGDDIPAFVYHDTAHEDRMVKTSGMKQSPLEKSTNESENFRELLRTFIKQSLNRFKKRSHLDL